MSAVGDIGRLTVEQLRKELTKYGLDKKGRKSVLLTRLLAFLDPEGMCSFFQPLTLSPLKPVFMC